MPFTFMSVVKTQDKEADYEYIELDFSKNIDTNKNIAYGQVAPQKLDKYLCCTFFNFVLSNFSSLF